MDEEQVVSTEEVAEEPKETQAEPEETKTEEVAPEVVEPPKPKKSAQERIDELTRKWREKERDAEYWKARATQQEPPKVDAQPVTGEPTLDQFETTEQYVKALVKWERQQEDSQAREERRKQEQGELLDQFHERANKLRAEHDDFDEVISAKVFSQPMFDAFVLSENGPELSYYLGTNATERERIKKLPAALQLVEIGKLETRLTLAKENKKVSAAPPPIKPVGMGGGAKEVDRSSLPINEWMALEKKEQIEKAKKKFGIT